MCICIIFCFADCKKQEIDYRAKYIGLYDFTINQKTYQSADSSIKDTTFYYVGDIQLGHTSNSLILHFSDTHFWEVLIDGNGKLSQPPNSGLGWSVSGNFDSPAKISFSIFNFSLYNVSGIKK